MKSRLAFRVLISIGVLLTSTTAIAAPYVSNSSGAWNTPATWNPNGVPGAGDTVTIQAGHTITLDSGRTIADVTVNGTLDLQSFTLSATNAPGITGTITGSSPGSLSLSGTGNWTAGTLTGSASLAVFPGATLTISGGSTKLMQSSFQLVVGGTVNWTGGQILLNTSSLLNIPAGGVFDAQVDTSIANNNANGSILNSGTFRKSAGAGTTTVSSGVPFASSGRLELTTGTIDIQLLTLNAGAVLGNFTIVSGTTTIAGAATIETGATTTFSGGTLGGAANLTVNGSLQWTGGTMSGLGGSVTIPAGKTSTISGGATKALQGSFQLIVAGTLNWTGGQILLNTSSLLAIQSGGVFDAQVDSSIANNNGNGSITNSGTFKKSAGALATTVAIGVPFASNGRIEVSSGKIDAQNLTLNTGAIIGNGFSIGSGTTTIAGPSTVETGATMTLEGGTLTGTANLTVNGTLQWTGGTMSGAGASVTIPAGKTSEIGGGATKLMQSSFQLIVAGTLNWTDGQILLNTGSLLDIQAGGVFHAQGDDSIANNNGNGSITNNGTFRKTGSATISVAIGVPFNNSGRIEELAGAINAQALNLNVGSVIAGLTVSSGTTTIAGASSVEALKSMTLAGGTLTGSATLTVSGTLHFTSGTMNGGAIINVPAGGVLNFSGTSTKTISGGFDLNIFGTANWTGGQILLNTSCTLDVQAGGLFDIQTDNSIANNNGNGTISNSGTVLKSAGAGAASVASGIPFSNSGRIDVLSGMFSAATLTLAAGTVIGGNGFTVNAATTSVTGTATVEAGATMTLASGVLSGSFPLTVNGTLAWTGGTMDGASASANIASGGTLNIIGGVTKVISGGFDLNIFGTANWTGGQILLNTSGTLDVQAGGLFDIQTDNSIANNNGNGTVANNGTFRKSAGAGVTTVSSGVPFLNSNRIDILSGTTDIQLLTLNAGSIITGTGFKVSNGTTTLAGASSVQAGSSMTLAGGFLAGPSSLTVDGMLEWIGGTMNGSAGNGSVIVPATGIVNISGTGTKTLSNGFDLLNTGTIDWTGGTILNNSSALLDNQTGGLFLIETDNTITNNSGNGSMTNSGTLRKINSTGTTAIAGGIPFTSSGKIDVQSGALQVTSPIFTGATILNFGINGAAPLTGYGRLVVTGNVNFFGTIDVDVPGPFVPQGGDQFSVVTYTSRSGTLTESLAFGVGRSFATTYNASNLTLTASGPTITPPLVPNNDTTGGGVTVTINGTGFQGAPGPFAGTVTFGGVAATTRTFVSSGQLTAVAPAHAAGVVDVVVTNPDLQPTTATNAFTYTANGDLSLVKTASTTRVATSGTFSYTLVVSNSGPSSSTNVTVTDTLPTGMSTTGYSGAGWSCSDDAGAPPTITCTMATLTAGTAPAITINVTAPATANPTLVNNASVTSLTADPNPGNNAGSATIAVIAPSSSITVVSPNDSGNGTLREALGDTNNGLCLNPCTIGFNLSPVAPIQPLTALPAPANATVIDGSTQPGYASTPLIEVNGGLCACTTGLSLTTSGNTVRALSITGFSTAGLHLAGTGGHQVRDSYIGVTSAATSAPNGDGILITSSNNTIGGVSDGNVISANTNEGIAVAGGGSTNAIAGNFIGTTPNGSSAMANGTGVVLGLSTNTTIKDNTIAFNAADGVFVSNGTGHHITGNTAHSNGDLPIDLLSVPEPTTNDTGDGDTGPNNLQNKPVIASAVLVPGDIRVTLSVDSGATAAASIEVEIFEESGALLDRACFNGNSLSNVLVIVPEGTTTAGQNIFATATSFSTACGAPVPAVSDGTSEYTAGTVVAACAPPSPTVSATATSFCTGGNVTLSVSTSGGTAPYAYQWYSGPTLLGGETGPTLFVTAGGSYTVTATDSIGCVGTSAPTTITELTPPVATITPSGPTTFCAGGSVNLTASAGASWLWSPGGATSQSITATASGNYTVIVTGANGCSTTSAPTTVTVQTTPTATITASGPTTFCQGGSVTLTASNGTSWLWSNGASSQSISVTASGSFTVTVSNGTCNATSSPTTVTVNPAPVTTISGPASVCPNTLFPLDAGAGFSSYFWSGGQTSRTITVSQSVSTTYSVTVTDGLGCSTVASRFMPLTAAPDPTISGPASVLPNSTGNAASATVQAGATYLWTITNGTIAGGQGTDLISFTAPPGGSVDLQLTVTISGCSAVGLISIPTEEADLAVALTGPAIVETGATFIHTITVVNPGPFHASAVSVTDFLPAQATLVSVAPGPWDCSRTGDRLNCVGSAAAGSSSAIALTMLAPNQPSTITNIVKVFSTADPNVSNDFATLTTTVVLQPVCTSDAPDLLVPADAAQDLTSPVQFVWSDVGALSYQVWIVSSGAPRLVGSTTATTLTAEVPSGTSRWFVVAENGAGCNALVSAERTFTVRTSEDCLSHPAPQMISPQGGTSSSPVTFAWTAVPQAIGYRLWIEVDGTAGQDIGTTSGALSLTTQVPPGAIKAYVDAIFAGCPDTRSTTTTFTVPPIDHCAGRTEASLISPVSNAILNTSSVAFHWNAAHDAAGYRVWASIDGAAAAVLGTTNETSLLAHIATGDVFWWVEALYEGCASTESEHSHFTIPAKAECGSALPELIGPANGAILTNGNVTFTWEQVLDAVGYEVYLATASGTPVLIGGTDAASTSLVHLVPAGDLEWSVRANIDRCPSRQSETSSFTFTPPAGCLDNQRPALISPLDDIITTAPIRFSWSAQLGATHYELFTISGTDAPHLVGSTTATFMEGVQLAPGPVRWFVRAHFGQPCSALDSEKRDLGVVPEPSNCSTLDAPLIAAPGQVSGGVPFLLQWAPSLGASHYQLQVSASSDFAGAEIISTSGTEHELVRTNTSASPLALFARVRAIDLHCPPLPAISPFGPISAIFILPNSSPNGAAPLGSDESITFTIPIDAQFAGQSFTAVAGVPWLTVSPPSGVVGANGATVTAVANPAGLPVGASLGAVTITFNTSGSRSAATEGTTLIIPTISISLVTPVAPTLNTSPPPDALIIPAVAHADGINSTFQSDVRVSNTSPQLLQYQLTFTPTGGAGIATGRQTTFSVEPGHTVALNDILATWFGTGSTSSIGMLEIRPLTETAPSTSSLPLAGLPNLVTFASSRTFNITANGTFGQSIPAIPFANFLGRSLDPSKPSLLSLQQIAQSDRFRTNLGLVEGSGQPASLLVKVFGDGGQKISEFPVQLAGGQHTQLNAFLTQQGVNSLSDGRVEIEVLSAGGKVTAYASVLDNETNDPLLVAPVILHDTGSTHWVVPGVADLNNGFANWQTDLRVFNAGTESVDATASFYSQNGGEPKTATITIPAGQVRQFDKTLSSLFNVTNDGGAIHLNTSSAARLVATARTYNETTGGTYGQFISAVTPLEAAGLDSRPLQLLQVEESSRYRSNIGMAEVTGNPVKLEISIVPPDAKVTTVTELTLGANEFRQIGSLLQSVGLDDTFNARVSIRVIEGTGRVTAYVSVIDALTNDPTYVPAQ